MTTSSYQSFIFAIFPISSTEKPDVPGVDFGDLAKPVLP